MLCDGATEAIGTPHAARKAAVLSAILASSACCQSLSRSVRGWATVPPGTYSDDEKDTAASIVGSESRLRASAQCASLTVAHLPSLTEITVADTIKAHLGYLHAPVSPWLSDECAVMLKGHSNRNASFSTMSFSSSNKESDGSFDATQIPGPGLSAPQFYIDGKLQFVGEKGGNGAQETYQDVSGAPVETVNPLGYSVGWWSAFFLNVTMLIGTGIFSFRESRTYRD